MPSCLLFIDKLLEINFFTFNENEQNERNYSIRTKTMARRR